MKVDTTKISGFEEMSTDEKLNAVLDFEFESDDSTASKDSEIERYKNALTKANSEAASYKKQLRERQSAEEVKAAQDAEEKENLLKQVEELTKEKTLKQYEASYLHLGYDENTAKENAEALHSGNMDVVFANHKKFIEEQKKMALSEMLSSQPGLTNGSPVGKTSNVDPFTAQLRKFAGLPK